ncbi:hypothetical protein C3476_16950 [Mycobacterium kansasii]|nr:hypothetical protein C3B43_13710 [Mycobacterium kansasii]POY19787.1 hypothetical protein C3476_16950 [Mycobacterium kansasii]
MRVRCHGESSYFRLWRLRSGGSIVIRRCPAGRRLARRAGHELGSGTGLGGRVGDVAAMSSPPGDDPDGGSAAEHQGN